MIKIRVIRSMPWTFPIKDIDKIDDRKYEKRLILEVLQRNNDKVLSIYAIIDKIYPFTKEEKEILNKIPWNDYPQKVRTTIQRIRVRLNKLIEEGKVNVVTRRNTYYYYLKK